MGTIGSRPHPTKIVVFGVRDIDQVKLGIILDVEPATLNSQYG